MGRRPKKNRSLDQGNVGRKESASQPTDRADSRPEALPGGEIASGPSPRTNNSYAVLAVCALLLLAVALVFGQTLGHKFVNFDDDDYVYNNRPVSRGLTGYGIWWAFTSSHSSNWHPLTWLSHMVDCQLYGLGAGGHHLTNVLLHAAAAILLFLVLRRMTGDLWPSAWVAMVFAIHPLRAESVAWVAERKDVLSGLFFMLTLGAYVGYVRRPFSLVRYLSVAVLFILGLMSKPMLVTLPFVLLLLDYWPLGRMTPSTAHRGWGGSCTATPGATAQLSPQRVTASTVWRLVVEKVPLFVLAAASCVVAPLAQGDAISPLESMPMSARAANALVSYVAYVGQFFYPSGLAAFYRHPGSSLPVWKVVGAVLLLAGISTSAVAWRRRFPYLFVGWFWYVGMLVPVIGLVQIGLQGMADRYTYLPQIGLCIALAWGAAQAFASWPAGRWVCGIGSALVVLVLMGCAWRQTSYWQDSETLWRRDLACTLPAVPAHHNLAMALADRGQTDEAIAEYRAALELRPTAPLPNNNLGVILAERGQLDEAIACYQRALKSKPDYAEAHSNLGVALESRGQTDAAIEHFRLAAQWKPDSPDASNRLGLALASRGQYEAAVVEHKKALKIEPDSVEFQNNLGIALAGAGQVDEAIAWYRKALAIKSDYADTHYNLGMALASRGQVDEAIAEYRKALKAKPDHYMAHNNLGNVMARRGQFDAAIAQYQQALKIKPDYADAHLNLATALANHGQVDAAIAEYRKVLASKPDHVVALNNLGNVLAGCGQLDAAVVQYQQALKIKPDYAEAHTNLGTVLDQQDRIVEAVAQWREVVRLQPKQVAAVNQLAWVLATCPEAAVRNGAEAVELAQRAEKLTDGREPGVLGTLAAAYAEMGRFSDAVKTAERAAALASARGDTALSNTLRTRVKLYQTGSPYRETRTQQRQ